MEIRKKPEEVFFHDTKKLLKIYRPVQWGMQVKIGQTKKRFSKEYGTDVDEFLEMVYTAGVNVDTDANIKRYVNEISESNNFLKLIDEALELMREHHPEGEKYYWLLYYTYITVYKSRNVEGIIDKLEPHVNVPRINRATYYRWLNDAIGTVHSILWGYEEESRDVLVRFMERWEERKNNGGGN